MRKDCTGLCLHVKCCYFRDREVCQFIEVTFCLLRSIIFQVLIFATICCDQVNYKWVNKLNKKCINASVLTQDCARIFKIKIGPVDHISWLISAPNRKCPKTGQSSWTLINMTAQWRYVMYDAPRFICVQITGIWNMFYTNNYRAHLSEMRST
jgi:hypothetical protein